MAFFKRKPSRAAKPAASAPQLGNAPTVDWGDLEPIDPYLGDLVLGEAVESLISGSWAQADAILNARGPEPLAMLSFADDKVSLNTLDQWCQDSPGARTSTLLGLGLISHAWAIRGEGYADTVKDWGGVHEKLAAASDAFEQALAYDPGYVEAQSGMLTLDMATGTGQDAMQRRFEQIHEIVPFHPKAVWTMVQGRAPKWGGSIESMMEFAHWVDANAPVESPSRSAIPEAHFEISLVRAQEGHGGLFTYMKSDVATEECRDAFERFLSGLDDDDPAPISHVKALNTFLFYSGLSDVRDVMLSQKGYRILGDRPTERPWEVLAKGGNPRKVFLDARFQRAMDIKMILDRVDQQRAEEAQAS